MPKETQLNQYVIPIHGIIGEPYHGNDKRQYFSFRDLLIHLNNSKSYDSIKLDISSDGGSVDEGKKMESAILAIGKPIFSENSGNVASAASRIFCLAPFENRSFNPDKGVFLIHNPWLEMAGDSKELANASEYLAEIEEDYITQCRCSYKNIIDYIKYDNTTIFIILLSWIGFLVGIIMYYSEKDRYFFKFSFKDLNERWES